MIEQNSPEGFVVVVPNELHRMPTYTRIHANYECGCSVYSDDWETEVSVPKVCDKHLKSLYGTLKMNQLGVRTKGAGVHYSALKIPRR